MPRNEVDLSTTSNLCEGVFSTCLFLLLRLLNGQLSCNYALTVTSLTTLTEWLVLEILSTTGRVKRTPQIPLKRRLYYGCEAGLCSLAACLNLASSPIPVALLWQLLTVFELDPDLFRLLIPKICCVAGLAITIFDQSSLTFGSLIVGFTSASFSLHFSKITRNMTREFGIDGNSLSLAGAPESFSVCLACATLFENCGADSFASSSLGAIELLLIVLVTFSGSAALFYRSQRGGFPSPIIELSKVVVSLILGLILFENSIGLPSIAGILVALGGAFSAARLELRALGAARDPLKKASAIL
jgi:hypothetical protein